MKPPEIVRDGPALLFRWTEGILVAAEHFREGSGEVKAELTFQLETAGVAGHLHWCYLNLMSTQGRSALAKKLTTENALDWFDWHTAIEQLSTLAVKEWRRGEPIVNLSEIETPATLPYLIERLLPESDTGIVFGDGESGKSLFGMVVAVAFAAGVALPRGLVPRNPGPVLYLDWESTDPSEHARRRLRVARGLGLDSPPEILYRLCQRPIHEEAASLAAEVARRKVRLIIIDSLAPACGDDPSDAAAAVRTMNALRSLGATRLAIGHVNRVDRERPGAGQTTFGSIFWRNMTRSMWQLQASGDQPESGEIAFALHHRKSNNDQRERWPLGFKFTFEPGGGPICLLPHDVTAGTELAEGATLAERIRKALAAGGKMSVAELQDAGVGEAKAVGTTLQRMPDVVSFGDAKGGRGNAKLWALRANGDAAGSLLRCAHCSSVSDRYSADGSPACAAHENRRSA